MKINFLNLKMKIRSFFCIGVRNSILTYLNQIHIKFVPRTKTHSLNFMDTQSSSSSLCLTITKKFSIINQEAITVLREREHHQHGFHRTQEERRFVLGYHPTKGNLGLAASPQIIKVRSSMSIRDKEPLCLEPLISLLQLLRLIIIIIL